MPDISMLNQVLENLSHVGIGLVIFILAYVSNMSFSLYYNIKILGESFDYHKLINSGLKLISFCIGVACLTTVITALPLFADFVGYTIPEEYTDVFSAVVIIAVPLYSSCKYAFEAFGKMKSILTKEGIEKPKNKKSKEEENKDERVKEEIKEEVGVL